MDGIHPRVQNLVSYLCIGEMNLAKSINVSFIRILNLQREKMVATLLHSNLVFHLPSWSALSKPMLARPLCNGIEVADGPSLFVSQSSHRFMAVSTIRADGDSRGRRTFRKSSAPGKTIKGDGKESPQPSDRKSANSSNQEEIISLFKRIQTSIAKGDSISSKKRSAKVSEDKPSSDRVLDVLHQSRLQLEGKTANKDRDKRLTRCRGPVKKEQKADYPSAKSSLSRAPSSFVKRSLIPSPSIPRERAEFNSEASPVADDYNELVSQKMRDMKLPELKELAKSRGIKGYSKLKKNELVELLISS